MSGSKTTQKTDQKTEPWAPAIPSVTRGLSAANAVYDQRRQQEFFPGQTYAGFSPQTQQALQGMEQRATSGNSATAGAQRMVGSTVNGDFLSAGNPYFSQMSNRITSEVLPSITAQWARAGRGTGNGQVVEAASRGLGDAIGQLAYQNYSDERGRQFQAAQMAPTLDYADLERLRAVGAEREAMDQNRINEEMMRYDYNQNRDANALAELQGFTTPIAQLGQQTQGTTTMTQRQSPLQTAIGAGLMGASLFGGGGPLAGMFSGMGSGLSSATQGLLAANPAMLGGYAAPTSFRRDAAGRVLGPI